MIGPTNASPKNTVLTDNVQTISAVKTFSVSPIVPDTPSGAHAAVNKTYADTKASTVETSITGDGSTTEFNISHSFGKYPQVSLYESDGTAFTTLMQVFVNSVKLIFITAPGNGVSYKVVMTR